MNVDIPNLLRALGIEARDHNGELWAPCPYPGHDENEPSWSIRWDGPGGLKNGHNSCFGCQEAGGPIHLVKRINGFQLSSTAREWIIKRGLDLGNKAPMRARVVIRGATTTGMKQPHGVHTGPLDAWITPSRRYAVARRITDDQVERWGLGYGTHGTYMARLYIPTHDAHGALVNWTLREFHGEGARYINPESGEGADKAAIFGERYWPPTPASRSLATLVVCEGELNGLAIERAGAPYFGALGGSKVDPRQLLRISQFGSIVLASDVDQAGNAVAMALKASLTRWRNVRRVPFPPRMDACDIEAHNGIDALEELLWDTRQHGSTN
ncbi:MAG: toprim domain-containing protein [Alphaproteobacteria bacterium]